MMDDPRVAGQAGAAGLCHACRHVDVIRSDRGSVFYLCRLSFTDAAFPRYPPIPVVACAGFARQPHEAVSARVNAGVALQPGMHTIEPARLKPGVTPDALSDSAETTMPRQADLVIRGCALIFWDPMSLPGTKFARKLDAIDTDQITPAADCVSESLDTLDEKWKAGSFRHLMPDFRQRVHRGENFIIAGDRFAIGSSREMSPAGLKGVAEEAGLEMVVVCGHNMGDIFRRNSFNLGLHVVQSPEAVADANDGDGFAFDPVTRRLTNETQGTTYDPVPLSPKEEEIRRSGGIFAVGRREFTRSVLTPPSVEWAGEEDARRMTTTEQIVWAHRVEKGLKASELKPGTTLRVYADLLPASDGTAPFAIHTFNQITGGNTIQPRQAAIANDHFVFTGVEADDKQTGIGREFARLHGIDTPYYATPGDGIFHFYFPEQGLVMPGQFIPGADSHSRAYGAYGAVGIGVGSTTLGFGWSTGYIYFTLAKQRRVTFRGRLQPWVAGKDIVLELLRRWGAKQSQGMSVELVDAERQLPLAYRNTIANMMAEAEALNGIFAPDETTYAWYRHKGITALPYPPIAPGPDAVYEIDEALDLSDVRPMIAKPFSPGNAFPAEEVAREHLTFDKAMIGSCTNGSYDDLLQAALVMRAAREQGTKRVAREFAIFPGSGGVGRQIEQPDPRLAGESIAQVFRSVGGGIRRSWCGPCFGQGPDALTPGQRAITSFNRNWQNRMGFGGEGYLASPAVVAASALVGYMAPPSELGLTWDAELYGV
jgi:3-isopropylmalate/(R)-2-methylmalate dehydratase large subunit